MGIPKPTTDWFDQAEDGDSLSVDAAFLVGDQDPDLPYPLLDRRIACARDVVKNPDPLVRHYRRLVSQMRNDGQFNGWMLPPIAPVFVGDVDLRFWGFHYCSDFTGFTEAVCKYTTGPEVAPGVRLVYDGLDEAWILQVLQTRDAIYLREGDWDPRHTHADPTRPDEEWWAHCRFSKAKLRGDLRASQERLDRVISTLSDRVGIDFARLGDPKYEESLNREIRKTAARGARSPAPGQSIQLKRRPRWRR